MNKSQYIGIGVSLGAGFGLVLGAIMHNVGLGLVLGAGLGTAFGAVWARKKSID